MNSRSTASSGHVAPASHSAPAEVWVMVLAAGEGRRLASVTGGVPKQYWRVNGGASLLEETFNRFAPITPASHHALVVDARHRHHLAGSGGAGAGARVLLQPEDKGTANGVLLGLLPVLQHDPHAIVILTPADHGVADDALFRRGLAEAVEYVRATDKMVLCGVEPSSPRDDFGWIVPAWRESAAPVVGVRLFVEKPDQLTAGALYTAGAVWNTMILAGRACDIRDACYAADPALQPIFEPALGLASSMRDAYLRDQYDLLPRLDFSRDVLSRTAGLMTYVFPARVGWTDLGTPDRLRDWTQRRHQFTAA